MADEVFSSPRVNVIASSQGFEVEVLGRVGIEYREAGRAVFVDSEVLMRGIMVLASSIRRWKPPYDVLPPITPEERDRIVDNIRRAIGSRGEPVEVH